MKRAVKSYEWTMQGIDDGFCVLMVRCPYPGDVNLNEYYHIVYTLYIYIFLCIMHRQIYSQRLYIFEIKRNVSCEANDG